MKVSGVKTAMIAMNANYKEDRNVDGPVNENSVDKVHQHTVPLSNTETSSDAEEGATSIAPAAKVAGESDKMEHVPNDTCRGKSAAAASPDSSSPP